MISRSGRAHGLFLHLITPNHVFLPCKKKQKQNRPADLHTVKSMIIPSLRFDPNYLSCNLQMGGKCGGCGGGRGGQYKLKIQLVEFGDR